jgi:iron only hydrogenase large subunit-like protein
MEQIKTKMVDKNNISQIEKALKSKTKNLIMIAPSFVTDFSYPSIIHQLKKLGFDKVVEVTFGAKMINKEYHKQLQKTKKLLISSTCPGSVTTIENNYPELKNQIIKINSPMIAMAKICKKHFQKHKIFFLSPCDFKKVEANQHKEVDYVIDFEQLKELFSKYKIKENNSKVQFDKFYNDYTKIYPLGGALSKTAHLKGILTKKQVKITDGVQNILTFLKNPKKEVLFLDCLFCKGGCIGGPHTNQKISIAKKRKLIKQYLKKSKKEDIPENRKGLIKKATGIKFSS